MVEIKNLKVGSDFDSGDPILVSAEADAINRIRGNSTNKPVFLIRISASLVCDKERVFVSEKLTETSNYLEITGVEVLNKIKTKKTQKTQKIDRKSQVLNEADSENIINIKFPWHKINEIQNVSYQHKKQNKENK